MNLFHQIRVDCADTANEPKYQLPNLRLRFVLNEIFYLFNQLWVVEVRTNNKACVLDECNECL